ncbi:hypothetical protein CUT44_02970 [Streptomyces carminius]|uniref:Uncharacterized protein n=1 Tax=Streptomyces carminius TaxID=2665496 RepID=A0A2M8M5K9_9ACTN|nr:hypothetical protein [Streptomyces carminius]PJE99502.1 hypothetical protein CUT44_02970 [Streptomyces carminius]
MTKTTVLRLLGPAALAGITALMPATAVAAPSVYVPTGQEVFIDHVQTGEHITPNGFAQNPTAFVDIWEDHNNVVLDTEKWTYQSVNGSGTTFLIKNVGGNDICLQPANVENRQIISTKTCSATNKQQWWHLYGTDTGVERGFTLRPYNETSLAITPVTVPSHNDQYLVLSPAGDYLNQVFRNRLA